MFKIACLGAGYFSQFHRSGWDRIDTAEIVGVADLDVSLARATGHPAFPDLASMLEACQPDILDIILPPTAQADAIRTALAYPLRAIICQKPFCLSLDEAEKIAALAEAKSVPLVIHENFRFQPWYRLIADQIARGRIGTPLQATFRLRPGDGQGADAYLARQPYFQKMERFLVHETLVHWIDTFRFLFGPIQSVYADLRQINPVIAGEDAGVVLMDHGGGVRSVIDGNRHLDHAAENTRCTMGEALIEGTQGTLDLHGDGSVWHRAFGAQDTSCLLPPDQSDSFGGDCAMHLQAHVIAALAKGRPFENLARDYLQVIRVEDAIYASARSGHKRSF